MLFTSGFVDGFVFLRASGCVTCIPKRQERNDRNSDIDSDQIIIVSRATEAKSVVDDFLIIIVLFVRWMY